jgi:endonuclease-3
LEHLLFACCLEDAHYEAADEAFAALVHTFFDWNEIRVTTITELSEVVSSLGDPRSAANRLKRVLQSVFETTYTFDLEDWRKKNLGPTVKWLRKLDGTTNFSIAYIVQSALGGHAIPVDSGVLRALRLVELISDEDVKAGVVPGLERAVSKAKGIEFGSLLHQLGADLTTNPYSPSVRKTLLQINPEVEERLPQRRARKASRKQKAGPADDAKAESAAAEKKATVARGKPKGAGAKKKSPSKEKPSGPTAKKPAATRKKSPSTKKRTAAAQTSDQADLKKEKKKEKPAAQGLSKRKPR